MPDPPWFLRILHKNGLEVGTTSVVKLTTLHTGMGSMDTTAPKGALPKGYHQYHQPPQATDVATHPFLASQRSGLLTGGR